MPNHNKDDALINEINHLEDQMHDADGPLTLEEKVADMKRRGIDPKDSYKKWDDENGEDDWGDENWKENGKWEPKTPADLDEKARENWDGDNGDINAPPFV